MMDYSWQFNAGERQHSPNPLKISAESLGLTNSYIFMQGSSTSKSLDRASQFHLCIRSYIYNPASHTGERSYIRSPSPPLAVEVPGEDEANFYLVVITTIYIYDGNVEEGSSRDRPSANRDCSSGEITIKFSPPFFPRPSSPQNTTWK